jgi:hypothetical protein
MNFNLVFRRFPCIALLAFGLSLSGQETMNNEGIIKLVKSGLTEDLILNVIATQPGSYAFGATDLIALKDASVSEKIINAMLARSKGDPVVTNSGGGGTKAAPAAGSRTVISGKGVYYKKGGEYFELLTEDVEWSSSGAIKNIASAGIVKKDLNGTVSGTSSRNFLTNPMEIVFAPSSGVEMNTFILLPLKADKATREFSVGPRNKKSGVAKGGIPFGVERVGDNQFRMVLQTPLGPGEYGILAALPADSATTTSKMHTFRVLL